jgi:predicted dehydrogenase
MKNLINIGVIGRGAIDETLLTPVPGIGEQFNLKKVLITDNSLPEAARLLYPHAEFVSNVDEIVNDSTIDLVIVSSKEEHSPLIEDVVKSGKHLRII